MDCIFCQIVKRKIPAKFLYEGKEVIGIKSVNPEAPVHLLIIPKQHIEWKGRFNKKELALLGRLIFVAKEIAIKQKIFEACKLIFNVGKTGHISHIHLHLIGGWKKKIPMKNI